MKSISLLFAALLAATAPAAAQVYPAKPVRIVVPTAPAGGTDLVGRMLAQKFAEAMGQPFVVENRGGAGTTLGTALVAKAPPDGYTILINHVSLPFNATYYRKLPYDTLKDLAPITLVATQPFLLVVHPSLPVRTVRELVALAKKRPGQLTYGSGGAGSGPHMSVELLKQAAGIDFLHVPYKGAGPAMIDLISGQVQLMIATMSVALPHADANRVRAVAITSTRRHPALPGLPAIAETVPGYRFEVWYGLYVPAGTPAAVIQRLNAEAAKILQAPDLREKLAAQGLETISNSPEQFSAFLRSEVETWAKVVKAIGQHAD